MDVKQKFEEKMNKSISILKESLNTVRAGRANPAMLDKVMVDYYGNPTQVKNMANLSVPEPRMLMITPFDPKTIPNIEKAINIANVGINPSNDGKVIRLIIPQVTEDKRKELVKIIKKMGEDDKIAIRNERRDANEDLKKLEKSGELTEDDLKSELESIQKMTDDHIRLIDQICAFKEKEILEV